MQVSFVSKSKAILLLVIILTNIGCGDDNVVGIYYSMKRESNVKHYVELYSDGTYLHVYVNECTKKENKGVWELYREDSSRKYINLYNWEKFGYAQELKNDWRANGKGVLIKNRKMYFDLDDYDLNFKKE